MLGGYAVNHYGYHRHTDDLDVWISIDSENAAKVSAALQAFAKFAPSKVQPSLFQQKDKVFVFGREPVRIDILTTPAGVEFQSCYGRRQMVVWDDISVPLIAKDDLKINKQASGRPKDLADIDALTALPLANKRKKAKRSERR